MAKEIFVRQGDRVLGPFSLARVQELVDLERVGAGDWLREGRSGIWRSIREKTDAEAKPATSRKSGPPSSSKEPAESAEPSDADWEKLLKEDEADYEPVLAVTPVIDGDPEDVDSTAYDEASVGWISVSLGLLGLLGTIGGFVGGVMLIRGLLFDTSLGRLNNTGLISDRATLTTAGSAFLVAGAVLVSTAVLAHLRDD